MDLPEPASTTGASPSAGRVAAVPTGAGAGTAAAEGAAEPVEAARLHAAQSAVEPWWSRAGAAGAVLLLADLGLLVVLLVTAGSAGTRSGSFVLSSSGTVTIAGLAVAAVVLVVALVLIRRRRRVGTLLGLFIGIVLTAVLGWVATSVVSFSLSGSTGMTVGLSVAAIAAGAATLVLALTHGRLLALGRIEDQIGVRAF